MLNLVLGDLGTLICTGRIKITSVTDRVPWGQKELTWSTCNAHKHADLQSAFSVPELEGKRMWMWIMIVRLCIYGKSILWSCNRFGA